ncbi:unnamed protein product [Durusdinium trenchii]|uniref:Uncharacterized protein n=2 Tax=Durusdinium trenchii TaxID=1381693 RepID=A0ABP0IFI5_9DINO
MPLLHQLELGYQLGWPRRSSFAEIQIDEEGIPRQEGGVPTCCTTGGVEGSGQPCLPNCRLDPRFMKSSAQLEAERIAEQEAKEHRSGLSQSREAREAGRNGQAGQVGQAGEASSSRRGPGRRQRRHAKEELAGEVSRFWGPDGQYNPYGQFFPAPPAPPRKPGFWLWRQSEEASKMSSPDPQYFVTDWMRRISNMNFKGWAAGPVEIEPKVVANVSKWHPPPPLPR